MVQNIKTFGQIIKIKKKTIDIKIVKQYICENIRVITLYCKVQISFKNYSNDCQSWWNIKSYIECELIVPFQVHMKSSIHVISKKKKP